MINKDEVQGKFEQAKGAAKEKVGEWTGDAELEVEGVVDQAVGEAQESAGTARRKAEDAAAAIKKSLDR